MLSYTEGCELDDGADSPSFRRAIIELANAPLVFSAKDKHWPVLKVTCRVRHLV
jgi:hypothetical protein